MLDQPLRSVTVLCILLTGLGAATLVWNVATDRHQRRLERIRTMAAAGVGALGRAGANGGGVIEGAGASGKDDDLSEAQRRRFRAWAWTALSNDDHLLGAALLDARGRLTELQPRGAIDRGAVTRAFAKRAPTIDVGGSAGHASLVSAAAADGTHVLLIAASPWRLEVTRTMGLSVALMAGAMLLGLLRLRRSFERSLSAPLLAIRNATRVGGERFRAQLPTERRDEIGEVARNVARMMDLHDGTRDRLGQMERTMDARVAAQTRRIEAMLARAEKRAWIDPLTGLGNRRLLDDRLESLFSAQRGRGEDLSVIMFDLDNFKQLNDTLGHAAGDEVLGFIGELLRCSLRPSDVGLRCGGDEFAAILLGTDVRQAVETAERLIRLFAQRAALYKVSPALSLSAGVASLVEHQPDNGEALLVLADGALYEAKRVGKSAVRTARAAPSATPGGHRRT